MSFDHSFIEMLLNFTTEFVNRFWKWLEESENVNAKCEYKDDLTFSQFHDYSGNLCHLIGMKTIKKIKKNDPNEQKSDHKSV